MLLAVPGSSPGGAIEGQEEHIDPGGNQNGGRASLRPGDMCGVLYGCRYLFQQLRQTAAPALGKEQRRPDHGEIQKETEDHIPGLGILRMASPPVSAEKAAGMAAL